MADLLTLQSRLVEAETARHRLLTGTLEVTVSLQGYGTATYTQSNIAALEKYIVELQNKIAALSGTRRRGPIRAKF